MYAVECRGNNPRECLCLIIYVYGKDTTNNDIFNGEMLLTRKAQWLLGTYFIVRKGGFSFSYNDGGPIVASPSMQVT